MQMYGKFLGDFPEKWCMKFGLVSYNDPCYFNGDSVKIVFS